MIFLYFASDSFASRAKVLTDSITKFHPNDTIVHVKPDNGPLGEYLPGMAKKRLEKALELLESTTQDVCLIGADCEFFASISKDVFSIFYGQDYPEDVIIVPHVQSPLKDRQYMAQLYQTGHANADFIVFRNCINSHHILKWLISVTEDGMKDGAFYEQTWLSSLPFLFTGIHILNYNDGYNRAYWNVNEVGLNRLVFFQYSGYEKGGMLQMSKHSKHKAKNSAIYDFYKAYDDRIKE